MAARKPTKPARAPDDREREAPQPAAPQADGAAVFAMLRDHEASGHLMDYAHTRNGACVLAAALVYLDDGEPLPPLIRDWMTAAIRRVMEASDSRAVADGLELLSGKRTGKLGGARQHERETTRLMLERIALEIAHKRNGESDKRIAERVAKRFNRSGTSAYSQWCRWRKVNRQA